MIQKVFSIYDCKAEAFLPPFYTHNARVAVRMLQKAATDTSHDFCRFAADYTLFEIGEWDDTTGMFLEQVSHVNHGTILILIGQEKSNNV